MRSKRSALRRRLRQADRRTRLSIEQLESRQLLTVVTDLRDSFAPPGFTHIVQMQQIDGTNNDLVITANEASSSYTIRGVVIPPDSFPPGFFFQHPVTFDLYEGDQFLSRAVLSSPDASIEIAFVVAGAFLPNGSHHLHIRAERPGFTAETIDFDGLFVLEVDTIRPTIQSVHAISPNPRNTPVSSVDIVFSEQLQADSFTTADVKLFRNDLPIALTGVTVRQVSAGAAPIYRIEGLEGVNVAEGNYVLSVDAGEVFDTHANSGTGMATARWTVDTTPPSISDEPALNAEDDTGASQSDAITKLQSGLSFAIGAGGADTVDFEIRNLAGGLVTSQRGTFQNGAYRAFFTGPINEGKYSVTAIATDVAGNRTISMPRELTIDITKPTAPTIDLAAGSDSGPSTVDDITSSLTPVFSVGDAELFATVQLVREGVTVKSEPPPASNRVTSIQDTGLNLGTALTHTYLLTQTDLAGNESAGSSVLTVVIDRIIPVVKTARLATADSFLPGSAVPMPVTTSRTPKIEVDFTEQQYREHNNDSKVELLLIRQGFSPQVIASQMVVVPASADGSVSQAVVLTPLLDDLGLFGQLEVQVRVTDSAGNQATSTSFRFFALVLGAPTNEAPGTPAFSTLFSLAAKLTAPAGAGATTILVDQPIVAGLTINIAGNSYVVNSVAAQGSAFQLTLKTGLSAGFTQGQPVSWLRPWTPTFDKSTQTVWFTLEDSGFLGHFDPAAGTVQLFDVTFQGGSETTALDPHGVAFDFSSHLTPRVWLAYRNDSSDPDTPVPPHETSRIAYLDLATGELVTFDFEDFHLEGSHNIQIDDNGTVWVTAEHSDALFEIDFDWNADGTRTSSLNSRQGRVIVHHLPEELGDRAASGTRPSKEYDFQVHGLQIVVDQRTGERYVWVSASSTSTGSGPGAGGSSGSTARVALLRAGRAPTKNVPAQADVWYEWNFDEALIAEGRLNPNDNDRSPDGHALFINVDDRETPGTPEDDLIIVSDSGRPRAPAGMVRIIDPSAVIRALQLNKPLPATTSVQSVRIPKLAGSDVDFQFGAPVQTFVDREGHVFFIDPTGGVGRFDPSDTGLFPNTPADRIEAPVKKIVGHEVEVGQIVGVSTPQALVPINAPLVLKQEVSVGDRSSSPGVDQYLVAATAQRRGSRNMNGPFRGNLNAGGVLYSTLAESDYLSTTVFAETVRKQMDVVISQGKLAQGTLRGRMAFAVRKDGSLILTARADESILDQQINLSKLLAERYPASAREAFLFNGEPNAVISKQGIATIFGVNVRGKLVQVQFNPRTLTWRSDLFASQKFWSAKQVAPPAGTLLVGEPTGFVDSVGRAVAVGTTEQGHVLLFQPAETTPVLDLTQNGEEIFASVAILSGTNKFFVYGSNQKGELVEYQVPEGVTSATDPLIQARIVLPATALARQTYVFQDVYGVVSGPTRHVFGVDGNARLVHYEINSATGAATVENVTEVAQSLDQVYGYFPFQQDAAKGIRYGGRVYAEVAPAVAADGTLYVYGTNGQDLIEFTRRVDGVSSDWQVANLTNDIYATSGENRGGRGQAPLDRVPANNVFGAPAVYVLPDGQRHVVQINADGEVVEYYYQNAKNYGRYSTQNISLRLSPVGATDRYTVQQGVRLNVKAKGVLANDALPNKQGLAQAPAATAVLINGTQNGTLTLRSNGSFTYTPNPGFSGKDTFVYETRDGLNESAPVTVTITVKPNAAARVSAARGIASSAGSLAVTSTATTPKGKVALASAVKSTGNTLSLSSAQQDDPRETTAANTNRLGNKSQTKLDWLPWNSNLASKLRRAVDEVLLQFRP